MKLYLARPVHLAAGGGKPGRSSGAKSKVPSVMQRSPCGRTGRHSPMKKAPPGRGAAPWPSKRAGFELPRGGRGRAEVVADDLAALYHELDSRQLADVRQRVARDRDQIGKLALLDRSDPILPA